MHSERSAWAVPPSLPCPSANPRPPTSRAGPAARRAAPCATPRPSTPGTTGGPGARHLETATRRAAGREPRLGPGPAVSRPREDGRPRSPPEPRPPWAAALRLLRRLAASGGRVSGLDSGARAQDVDQSGAARGRRARHRLAPPRAASWTPGPDCAPARGSWRRSARTGQRALWFERPDGNPELAAWIPASSL